MTNDLFSSSYRHLDVEPGSSWQEVRRAYKRSVKKWHPDHFHNDSKTQSIAAEKIKEINCAFDLLSEHYRTHGVLPLPGESPATTPYNAGGTRSQEAHRAAQPPEPSVDHVTTETVEHDNQPSVQENKRSGVITRLAIVGLVAWLGYILWQTPPVSPESAVERLPGG